MDIRHDMHIGTDDARFSLRTGALILRDGCILAACLSRDGWSYTVGGGVRMGESTEEALLREIREETGVDGRIGRLAYVYEGFFSAAGKAHHEVCFFYEVDAGDFTMADGTPTDHAGEILRWIPVNKMEEAGLVPVFLREALREPIPDAPVHVVWRET